MTQHNDSNWERISELFSDAIEIPPRQWQSWLLSQCNEKERQMGMDTYVLKLLRNSPKANAFFDDLNKNIEDDLGQESEIDFYKPGDMFDKFRILKEIGTGGMARVFLCERADGQFDHKVAIKLMRVRGDKEFFKEKFQQEQQILAGFNHPNIAQLFDGGISPEGFPYMIMEYVEGEPIDKYCQRLNPGVKEIIALFLQVCDALQYAHNKLVVHHDIKPANILVNDQGMIKLLDFGISHVIFNQEQTTEKTTSFSGTLRYASPEQFEGANPSVASDIYKMGLVLYYLLTNDHFNQISTPDGQKTVQQDQLTISELRSKKPLSKQNSLLLGDLFSIFTKSLNNDPNQRFVTVSALQHDLQNILKNEPLHSHSPDLTYKLKKNYQRNKTKFWLLTGFNIALLTAGLLLLLQYFETIREKQRAEHILEFVWNIFESADPEQMQGDTITVYELLENSLPQIELLGNEADLQAELYHITGRIYTKMGFWQKGTDLYYSALQTHEKLPGNKANQLNKADILQNLALSKRNLSQSQLADSIIDVSLELLEKHSSGNNPIKYVEALNVKSRIKSDLAQYDQSIEYANKALEIMNHYTSDAHIEKVRSLTLIASSYRLISQYDEALSYATLAMEMIDELEPGINSLKLLAYGVYSTILANKGMIDESIAMEMEIYDMKLEVYGENKPITLVTLSNLATRYFQLQEYTRSDSINLIALEHYKTTFGEDHNFTTTTLFNLGNSYYYQGKYNEAHNYLTKSLNAETANLGETHPYLAGTMQTIGLIHLQLNELNEAEANFNKAIEILQLNFGEKHRNLSTAYGHLANLYCVQGKYSLCKDYFDRALNMSVDILGDDHNNTLSIRQKYEENLKHLVNL